MPFIEDIVKYNSVSIVGLEKNTGKTECLNYVLNRLKDSSHRIALTSIGLDGETVDQVTQTSKPRITIFDGMIFTTAENLFRKKRLSAEILNVSNQRTALGRLVTAKAISTGPVIISGPADTNSLKDQIKLNSKFGSDTTLVDGALSRISLASPATTDAMILTTGAALSANITELVRKTKFIVDLIHIEEANREIKQKFLNIESGFWTLTEGKATSIDIQSVYLNLNPLKNILQSNRTIYTGGAITDKLLNLFISSRQCSKTTIIAKDFTRFFVTPNTLRTFYKEGGTLNVMKQSQLLAVCINPLSPENYYLNSEMLKQSLEDALQLPVYDVRKL